MEKVGAVLIVGGGIGGTQAALDLIFQQYWRGNGSIG
jgi:glycerol-3-phosphate dehydrogenase